MSSDNLLRFVVRLAALPLALALFGLFAGCGGQTSLVAVDQQTDPVPAVPTTAATDSASIDSTPTADAPAPDALTVEPSSTAEDLPLPEPQSATLTPSEEPTSEAVVVTETPANDLGSGTIIVSGIEYVFTTEFCANDEDGIFNQGSGVTADGTPFTGGIFAIRFSGGYAISADLSIGQAGIYSAPDVTQPFLSGSSVAGYDFGGTVDGARVSGSGQAIDQNEVLLGDGETILLTFDGECGDPTVPGADATEAELGSNYCEIARIEADRSTAFSNNFQMSNAEFKDYLTGGVELASQIDRPAEIAAELDLVHTALAEANERAKQVDYNFLASAADMVNTIGTPDVIVAGLVIADYNERVCGIDGPTQ